MSLLDFALLALAVWRISALLSYERGPGNVFLKFREKFGIRHGDDGEASEWPDTYPASVLVCVWCLSLTLALPATLAWLIAPDAARCVSLPFALGAAAVAIERLVRK